MIPKGTRRITEIPVSSSTREGSLMPRSSPRPHTRRHKDRHAAIDARHYLGIQSEREYAALADQLDALEHDIRDAREVSLRSRRMPGLALLMRPDTRTPSPHGEPVALADGARILIRPVEPDDVPQLHESFERLGALSRYRLFLTPIDYLSERQLAHLTHVDHQTHEALLAIDTATGECIGIARFVRDPEAPRQAEVAFAVADPWQGRGVGRALAEHLADRARGAGVESFTARMLIGNHAGRRLLERVAGEISQHENGGTIDLTAWLRIRKSTGDGRVACTAWLRHESAPPGGRSRGAQE